MLKTAKQPQLTLDARIEAIHAEINAAIDAKAAELKKLPTYEGIPLERIAHDIRVRAWKCPCFQYRGMKEFD